MTQIFLGRGAVVVENPTRNIKEGLRRFVHTRRGGEYENLYFMSQSGDTMSTLPGYASRVIGLCPEAKIRDERIPMPCALMGYAVEGLHELWHDVVADAIKAGGGVVAIPEMFGSARMAAAIARAFPRQGLVDRGTPLTIIAARDRESVRRTAFELREMLPGRDIGMWSSGSRTDSDDIIVSTYGMLQELPLHSVGIFIGDDLTEGNFDERAEGISGIRNAARWGIYTTPAGWCECVNIDIEGLFGPLVASATYRQAVDAGVGVPITVCWMDAPLPDAQLGSAPLDSMEATSMQKNQPFVQMVADIVRRTSNDIGCIVCTEPIDMVRSLKKLMPELAEINRKVPAKERRGLIEGLAGGTIRKAVVTSGCWPLATSHGVMDVSGWRIPWRHLKSQGDRAFIVDFRHGWDVNNGCPGVLVRNDGARERRYRELGFNQITVSSINELPFIGG